MKDCVTSAVGAINRREELIIKIWQRLYYRGPNKGLSAAKLDKKQPNLSVNCYARPVHIKHYQSNSLPRAMTEWRYQIDNSVPNVALWQLTKALRHYLGKAPVGLRHIDKVAHLVCGQPGVLGDSWST